MSSPMMRLCLLASAHLLVWACEDAALCPTINDDLHLIQMKASINKPGDRTDQRKPLPKEPEATEPPSEGPSETPTECDGVPMEDGTCCPDANLLIPESDGPLECCAKPLPLDFQATTCCDGEWMDGSCCPTEFVKYDTTTWKALKCCKTPERNVCEIPDGDYVLQNAYPPSSRKLYAKKNKSWKQGFGAQKGVTAPDMIWKVTKGGDGAYTIIGKKSGRKLYAKAGLEWTAGVGAAPPGGKILENQKWNLICEETGQWKGTWTIENKKNQRRLYARKKHEWSAAVGADFIVHWDNRWLFNWVPDETCSNFNSGSE